MFFKTKVAYPGLIRSLCLENIKWYNDLLDNDNTGFSQEIHEETCLIYLNVSLMTYFLMHGEIIHRNALPSKYRNIDMNQVFTNSLYLAFIDSGYTEIQAQEFLTSLDEFVNVFNEYRNRFDEELLKSKDSNAHVLKGASSSLVMDKLSDSGVINNNEEYLIMNEQVCKFINTIMLENMDAFNKVFKQFKII